MSMGIEFVAPAGEMSAHERLHHIAIQADRKSVV